MEHTQQVELSDSAAKRVTELLKNEAPGTFLRVGVDGGGCSGFQYTFDFDTASSEDDLVLKKDAATVHIDAVSLPFLAGATIDFVETLGAAHFSITNPNASANCGCGNSFSV